MIEIYFSHTWRLGSPRPRYQQIPECGGPASRPRDGHLPYYMAEVARALSGASFVRALIPSIRALFYPQG